MSKAGSDIAIKISALHKKYPKRVKTSLLSNRQADEWVHAINNLSVDIKRGEVIGLIGRNGSGKSTLLRLISGIEKPSSGQIELYGKVAAILDIGSGFHPELTGRENVFFRGGLLGMSNQAIHDKFDEIVDFSGIADYIDTPVKHYSDGMFLRLAFSTLVYVKADIILFDEILAVGDIDFQEKSREKIKEIAAEGRTVIVASHSMEEVAGISDRVLSVDAGKYTLGLPSTTISDYRKAFMPKPIFEKLENEPPLEEIWLSVTNEGNIGFRQSFFLNFKVIDFENHNYGIGILNGIGSLVVMSFIEGRQIDKNTGIARVKIDTPLNIGRYHIDFNIFTTDNKPERAYGKLLSFNIEANEDFNRHGINKTPFLIWEDYQISS